MVLEFSHGLMEVSTEASFSKTILRAMAFINGLMDDNMKVLGKLIKWKEKDSLHG